MKTLMTRADPAGGTTTAPEAELRHGAISFVDALVIGPASTSPAYSLAVIIGPVVALVGVHTPGVVLASFVPILLIASAFYHLNRADQDCGTTFSWVTRALGPWLGWIGGWAIAMTGVLVVGSLADTAVRFGLLTVGLESLTENTPLVVGLTVLVIVAMTAVCVVGTDISARFQNALILLQVASLLVFAVVALYRALAGTSSLDAQTPSITWLDPFAPEASSTGTAWFGLGPPLVIGMVIFLLGVAFMAFWRFRDATHWRERAGVAPDPVTGDPAPGDPATGGPESARVRR